MKKIFTFICIGAMTLMSCSKTEFKENTCDKGFGMLNMDMNMSALTKAAMTTDELENTAKVNIYNADFSGMVRSYTYSSMPSPFYLAAGEYRVDVLAGESVKENPSVASWEQKSYKGSKKFSIVAGQVNDVQVEATIDNAVTDITFDQTVVDNFLSGYTFTIALDHDPEGTKLVYDASKSGAEGYFIVSGLVEPSFVWTFTGTVAKGSKKITKTGTISDVKPGRLYTMNLKYTIKDGDFVFELVVDDSTVNIADNIVFEPVSTGLALQSQYEVWATKATVHADVDETENAGKPVQFAYRAGSGEWMFADAVKNETSNGNYHLEIKNLTPSTEYTYKLVVGGEDAGDPATFTTEAAPNLPNASFEYVSLVTGTEYYKFYDPNCGVDEGKTMFWGSGNGEGPDGTNGSANLGYIITQVDKNDKKDGTQSVKLVNSEAAGLLTAGNIFAGQFRQINGMEGGVVDFGRPWTSRPSALKFWAKYTTGKIDTNADKIPSSEGLSSKDYDRAQIKIAIGNWNFRDYNGASKITPVGVDTGNPSTFVDFFDDRVDKADGKRGGTIANGDLVIYNDGYSISRGAKVTATTSGWIEYTIPIHYYNEDVYPETIIISCSASQFGDYFAGYKGSTLWLDGFQLIY